MVTKKPKPKRAPKKANPLKQLHKEMEVQLKGIQQNKTKIKELAKSTIDDLKKLHNLHKKAKKIQPENNNHKFELDYELTNLKIIKKILSRTTPYEIESQKKLKAEAQVTMDITKVLIVEDDPTTIKIVKHILEHHNFKVGFALDAEDGLKKAFKEKPDLILLDIMLPGMNGIQVLSKLKASKRTSQIPVIILSSLSAEKDVLKGLEKGAADYILKPFSPQILLFKIKTLMSTKNEHITFNRHV
jgi:PleD family two-component response regulator